MSRKPALPIDYVSITTTLVREIKRVSLIECIIDEPKVTNAPRPCPLPYFSFKLTSPGIKQGDDSKSYTQKNDTTLVVNTGGVRKMMVSFQCYATDEREAYEYMSLWQSCLDQLTTQENLRRAGIAVWVIGNVADLSQLLNTGYEGRAQMDVSFGIAANLEEEFGAITKVGVTGTIDDEEQELFDTPET